MKSLILFLSFCLLSMNYSAAQCLNVNYQQVKNQPVYKSTGNSTLDKVLNTEKANLETIFKIKVDLKILDDSQSPNAYATNESSNPYFFDGTVYIGYTLLNNELMKRKNGVYAVKGIMAHEFGHILQSKLKCALQGSQRELHADFLAGYYVAVRGEYKNEADLTAFAESIYEKGDSELWDESHHGTPEQRLKVMLAGYAIAQKVNSPQEAYLLGIQLLTNDGDDGNIGQNTETTKPVPSVKQRQNSPPQQKEEPQERMIVVKLPNGVQYNESYSIFWELGGQKYSGMLVMKNGVGKMRLTYKEKSCGCNHIVEQNMTLKTSSDGTYIKGSNPRDLNKDNGRTTYNADNFFIIKNQFGNIEIWNLDDAGNKVQVDLKPITDKDDADEWLEELEWY